MNRRAFFKHSAAVAAAGSGLVLPTNWPARAAARRRRPPRLNDVVDPDSTFFSTASVESSVSHVTNSDGDLWPSCWADDGNLYLANGDGKGFGGDPWADIAVSRVYGTPETGLSGERLARAAEIGEIWADPNFYNRKPTGMLAVDGNGDGKCELYLAIQDLRKPPCPECFNDAPNASISRSDDYGATWQKTSEPMFSDHVFTTIFFLDFGKAYEHVHVLGPDGTRYVYAYGIDHNWRSPTLSDHPPTTDLYLARVPRKSIQDRSTWEFFAGITGEGATTWTSDIEQRRPVLHDERRVYEDLRCGGRPVDDPAQNVSVISQGSVVYNAPLARYIYSSWTWYTFEFYEAPTPWGPWRLFLHKDWGATQWYGTDAPNCPGPKNGGYPTTIPSKFISEDGRTMWVATSAWKRWNFACGAPNYNFGLRKLEVEPFEPSQPTNASDPSNNLAISGEGATPIEKSARFGQVDVYNDAVRNQHETSFDCEADKPTDFWGFTWTQSYHLDRVVYTTGRTFDDGGWFADLRVQVRQDFEWIDVEGLSISPDYPPNRSAGPNKTYALSFNRTWGDGVRIIGAPGGMAGFTTIGELEVYFAGHATARDDQPAIPDRLTVDAVYPNPVKTVATVAAHLPLAGLYRLRVHDVVGHLVHSEDVTAGVAGRIQRTLDLRRLAGGSYAVSLEHTATGQSDAVRVTVLK